VFRKDYPFSTRDFVKFIRPMLERHWKEELKGTKTIGEMAHAELKRMSKKDFGADVTKWRKWVENS
jgi:hypothetical protein